MRKGVVRGKMEIFDCHIHLFPKQVIHKVQQKNDMVKQLKLGVQDAEKRTSIRQLQAEMAAAGVTGALMLPTARVDGVRKTNLEGLATAAGRSWLYTAGTLHPHAPRVAAELAFLRRQRIRIIKLCSFSQGFPITGPKARDMFDAIAALNRTTDRPLAVVVDTLRQADRYFGTPPEFNTAPQHLAFLADRYPSINFIGAHMGGLDAPHREMRDHLTARANLYLDTSNAAHTLPSRIFCELLHEHGPGHILYGTDWPWFSSRSEIPLIDDLLSRVGFSEEEKQMVFRANILALLETGS